MAVGPFLYVVDPTIPYRRRFDTPPCVQHFCPQRFTIIKPGSTPETGHISVVESGVWRAAHQQQPGYPGCMATTTLATIASVPEQER